MGMHQENFQTHVHHPSQINHLQMTIRAAMRNVQLSLGALLFLIATTKKIEQSFITIFPTSLCGVLVCGCALPPASACLPPSRPPPASHTTCPHTIYSHTTYSYTTSSHTTCPHNFLSHNLPTHTQLVCPWRHRPSLCVAGLALGDIDMHSTRQAWHLWRCMDWLWWHAWFPIDAVGRPSLCVAGHGTW